MRRRRESIGGESVHRRHAFIDVDERVVGKLKKRSEWEG